MAAHRNELARTLAELTVAGEVCETLDGGAVRCVACAHRCHLKPGDAGICRVRFNRNGELRVPFGYTCGLHDDPVEKKPFFHLRPGTRAMSFGMLGCNFHCDFCQNWQTTQVLRDDDARATPTPTTAERIVALAHERRCEVVASTYNEPLITSEWAVAVFRLARQAGLRTAYISNGHASPEVLDYLAPWLDACNVDLKCFNERSYRRLGGRLTVVRETIAALHARGIWTEVVTLLVPGFNDGDDEIRAMAGFVAGVSPDIPWHVTAFHPDYRLRDTPATPPQTLLRAWRIGREAGLRFIYSGNLPGRVGDTESTLCPGCGALCVARTGHAIGAARLIDGGCPKCGRALPGCW